MVNLLSTPPLCDAQTRAYVLAQEIDPSVKLAIHVDALLSPRAICGLLKREFGDGEYLLVDSPLLHLQLQGVSRELVDKYLVFAAH